MRTEKILAVVFLIGLSLKFLNISFAGTFLVISLVGLGILYFPGAYYFFSAKEIKRQNSLLSIFSGFFLSMIPLGILFKLMYWPGGGKTYLIIGALAAIVIFIISYISRNKAIDDLKRYYKNMVLRTIILFIFAILFLLTPTEALLKIQYNNDHEFARVKALYIENPDNEEYKNQYDAYMLEHYPEDSYSKYLQNKSNVKQ